MITLRPYDYSDAHVVAGWLKDEKAFLFWSAGKYGKFPIDGNDINDYYAREEEGSSIRLMTACDGEKVIGHMMMRYIDEEKKNLRFGFIVVDNTMRGRGYGKRLIGTALTYAFEKAGAERVTLGVFENNLPALNCYLSCGFERTGNKEEYELAGERWTFSELAVTKEKASR